jgi:hypothetical protein
MPFDYRRADFVFKALDWANAITAVTQELVREVIALSGRQDVHPIHNGVDADRFDPQSPAVDLRAKIGLDDQPINVIGEQTSTSGCFLTKNRQISPNI